MVDFVEAEPRPSPRPLWIAILFTAVLVPDGGWVGWKLYQKGLGVE